MHSQFFSLIGSSLQAILNSPFYKLGSQKHLPSSLSYDPNRLFSEEKIESQDKFYTELQLQQEQISLEQDYEQIKEKAKEQFQNRLKARVRKITLGQYRQERAECTTCTNCQAYKGNCLHNTYNMNCLECKCPMNAHVPIRKPNYRRDELWRHLNAFQIKDYHLRGQFTVLLLKGKQENVHKNKIISKLQKKFKIVECRIVKDNVKNKLITTCILGMKDVGDLDALLQIVRMTTLIEKVQMQNYFSIVKNIKIPFIEKEQVLVAFLLRSKPETVILKMSEMDITPFETFKITSNKKQSLLYSLQFFEQLFLLHHRLFFVPTTSQVYKSIYALKDTLDANNYSVTLPYLKNIPRTKVQAALQKVNSSKVSFILSQAYAKQSIDTLGILSTAKIGTPTLTVPPTTQFIELPYSNIDGFAKRQWQRCILILRPYICGDLLTELLIHIMRINSLNILNRKALKLQTNTAQYLRLLQGISDEEQSAYVQMMTSSACEIVVMSKLNAIQDCTNILSGCVDGPLILDNVQQANESIDLDMPVFSGLSNLLSYQTIISSWNGMTRRQKQSMCSEIGGDRMNYVGVVAQSERCTEELIAMVLPEQTLMQSVMVILRPGYLSKSVAIRRILHELRYHVVTVKAMQLASHFTSQLVLALQKDKLTPQQRKYTIEQYSSQGIEIMCLAKVGARRELHCILNHPALLVEESIQVQGEILLRNGLFLVEYHEEVVIKLLNKHLGDVKRSVEYVTDKFGQVIPFEEKKELINYFVGTFYGTRVEVTEKKITTPLGEMYMYRTNESIARQQSWYYATLSQYKPTAVPLLFQYRTFDETTLVIQSTNGYQFLDIVTIEFQHEQSHISKKRKSLIAYVWAKKLIELADGATQHRLQGDIEGFGQIVRKHYKYTGMHSKAEAIANERKLLKEALDRNAGDRQSCRIIKGMLQSRLLEERYSNGRLIGVWSQQFGVRVVERSQVKQLHMVDREIRIDPDNQRNLTPEQMTETYALQFHNVVPEIHPKYHCIAQIFTYFRIQKQSLLSQQMCYQLISLLGNIEQFQYEVNIIAIKNGQRVQDLKSVSLKNVSNEEGKQRRFLAQPQYYKGLIHQENKQKNILEHDMKEEMEENELYNPKDYLHARWAKQPEKVVLWRKESEVKKKGIHVQYQNRVSEREQIMAQKIQDQVNKLTTNVNNQILEGEGNIWYRQTKGQQMPNSQKAILNQVQKFLDFKNSVKK